jgi:hypothetical protein
MLVVTPSSASPIALLQTGVRPFSNGTNSHRRRRYWVIYCGRLGNLTAYEGQQNPFMGLVGTGGNVHNVDVHAIGTSLDAYEKGEKERMSRTEFIGNRDSRCDIADTALRTS